MQDYPSHLGENQRRKIMLTTLLGTVPLGNDDASIKKYGDLTFNNRSGALSYNDGVTTLCNISVKDMARLPDTVLLVPSVFPMTNYTGETHGEKKQKVSKGEKQEASKEWDELRHGLLNAVKDFGMPVTDFSLGTLQKSVGGLLGAVGCKESVIPAILMKEPAYRIAMRQAFGKLIDPVLGARMLGIDSDDEYHAQLRDPDSELRDILLNVLSNTNYDEKELGSLKHSASIRQNYALAVMIEQRMKEINGSHGADAVAHDGAVR